MKSNDLTQALVANVFELKRPFGDFDGRNDHGGGGEATSSGNLQ